MTDNKIRITDIVAASAFVLSMISLGALLTAEDSVGAHTHPTHVEAKDIEALEMAIESQTSDITKNKQTITAMTTREDSFKKMVTDGFIDLRGDIAFLKAGGDTTRLPRDTPDINTADYNLRLADARGVFKTIFERGDGVLITGLTEYPSTFFRIIVEDPNDQVVKEKDSAKTYSDGDLSEAYIIKDSDVSGIYKITITLKAKVDTITFEVR